MSALTEPYPADVSHRSWDDQRISGTVTIDRQNLIFRGGEIEVVIPLSRLIVAAAGAAQWRFHDAEDDDWSIQTSDKRILENYFFTYTHAIRKQVLEIAARQEGLRSLRLAPTFLLLFLTIAAVGWFLTTRSVGFLVSRIPNAWETELGDDLLKQLGTVTQLRTGEPAAALESLANRLMPPESRRKHRLRIYILDDPQVNAAALPGGIIVVNSGTLDSVREPGQLAGILAHEIAHILERHSLRKLIGSVGPQYALRLFLRDKAGLMSALARSSHLLLRQNFSREYERQADARAWQLLVAARIDPRGLTEALRGMQANRSPVFRTEQPSLLSTHPPTEARIKHLETLWTQTSPKTGFIELR